MIANCCRVVHAWTCTCFHEVSSQCNNGMQSTIPLDQLPGNEPLSSSYEIELLLRMRAAASPRPNDFAPLYKRATAARPRI